MAYSSQRRAGATAKRRSDSLRVLWVADSLKHVLTDAQAAAFAREGAKCGLDLELMVLKPDLERDDVSRAEASLRAVHCVGALSKGDIGAFLRLRRHLRSGDYDIIHNHRSWASLWGATVGRMADVPVVSTLYGTRLGGVSGERLSSRERQVRWVLRRWAARVVALSGAQWDHYVRHGVFDRAFIEPIHQGVDVQEDLPEGKGRERLQQWLRGATGFPPWAQIAVTLADLDDSANGLDTLLWAVPRIVQANAKARFVIVGEGSHRGELERRVRARGLNQFVSWLGSQTEVQPVLAASDLFIHPSLRDPFPVGVLKAMAAGVPVIGTGVGGVPEIIGSSEAGRLVPRSNAEALADAAIEVLADPQRLRAMGLAARMRAASVFPITSWVVRTARMYRTVVEQAERGYQARPNNFARLSVELRMLPKAGEAASARASERDRYVAV